MLSRRPKFALGNIAVRTLRYFMSGSEMLLFVKGSNNDDVVSSIHLSFCLRLVVGCNVIGLKIKMTKGHGEIRLGFRLLANLSAVILKRSTS